MPMTTTVRALVRSADVVLFLSLLLALVNYLWSLELLLLGCAVHGAAAVLRSAASRSEDESPAVSALQ